MNISQIAPLNVLPTLPVVFNAFGVLKAGERGIEGGLFAIDSRSTPTVAGLDGLYGDGVTIFGLKRLFTNFHDLPGSHMIVASYGTGEYTNLDSSGWHLSPGDGLVTTQKQGSWMGAYIVEQKFWVDPCSKDRSIGFWGMTGFSDPDTSPYEWTMNATVQAFGMMGREHDRMGMGYFYESLNYDFRTLPGRLDPLQNLQGGEAYYNWAVNPWFHITTDLQVVDPGVQSNNAAVILGLRVKIDL